MNKLPIEFYQDIGEWIIPIDDVNGELTTKREAKQWIRVLEAEPVEEQVLKLRSALKEIMQYAHDPEVVASTADSALNGGKLPSKEIKL